MKKGLSLVELLIAIILTTIVSFIALELIRGEHANYTITREKIKTQSDSREAFRIMEEEIKNAGYRTRNTIAASTLTYENCPQAIYTTTGTSINEAVAGSIEFRMFNAFENFTCSDADMWVIGYRLNGSVLERRASSDGPAEYAKARWLPFLEGVTSFKIQYGQIGDGTDLITQVDQSHATDPASLFTTNGPLINVDQTGSDRPWLMTNWAQTTGTVFLNKNINLEAKSTYRISFRAFANASFLAGLNDVTLPKVLIKPSSGSTPLEFSFKPGPEGVSRKVQFDISPTTSETYNFGFSATMQSAVTNPSMNISNISIQRINSGTYRDWFDESTTPLPSMTTVGAVKISLNSIGKKGETLSFERIIPVVNNVNN